MKKNTIQYLNSKWWYRLIKILWVAFWLFFIGIMAFKIFSYSYDEYKKIDRKESMLVCLSGTNRGAQIPITEYKIKIGNGTIEDSTEISDKCGFPEYPSLDKFRLRKAYKGTIQTILTSIFFTILSIITLVIIEEILKRLFYYVCFGEFFLPKK